MTRQERQHLMDQAASIRTLQYNAVQMKNAQQFARLEHLLQVIYRKLDKGGKHVAI